MDERKLQETRRRLLVDPKSILAAARRGSPAELTVLSNVWPAVSGKISPSEIIDVFLTHLQPSLVPSDIGERFTNVAARAFTSLLGLSQVGPLLQAGPSSISQRILQSWPGVYAWSLYMFQSRIETLQKDDPRRKSTVDVISACWNTLASNDVTRETVVTTPAIIEVATKLWLEEEDDLAGLTTINVPPGTCILGTLIKHADYDMLQRVLKAAGGKPNAIAKRTITRLCNALKAPRINGAHLTVYMDFINYLSRSPEHPFRSALLSAHVIWHITSALVKISAVVTTPHGEDPAWFDAIVSGFMYLYNCLDSTDGFTWVSQAIDVGLLQAFCDCSPKFDKLDPDDRQMILDIFRKILPRYLVYRSVIESVEASMNKVDKSPHRERVVGSVAKDVWGNFRATAHESSVVLLSQQAIKGTHLTCDNVKCQKVGTKENVRRCGACLNTFYCSKECQAIAWKEGDHKNMCKMKQQARLEGKSESISKRDGEFFHHISIRDARKHLPHLRRLAKKDYPNLNHNDLVIRINYAVVPPTYSLTSLDGYATGPAQASDNALARNDAMIEKVQQNRANFTLIESLVSCGQGRTCVLTLARRGFWTSDANLLGGGHVEGELVASDEEDDDDQDWQKTNIDEVDQFRARQALNSFLRMMGEEETF